MAQLISVTDILLKNRHFLEDYSNGLYQDLSDDLKKAQTSILKELEKIAIKEKKGKLAEETVTISRAHHRRLLAETTQALKDAYGDFPDTIQDGMGEEAKLEYNAVANALRTQAGIKKIARSAPNMGIPGQALKELYSMPVGGALLKDWVEKQHANARAKLRSAVSQGLIRGLSMPGIAREIRKGVDMSRKEALVLARTAVMDASNKAIDAAYDSHSDLIAMYVWLATLDEKTCPVCGDLDGERHKEKDKYPPRPIHPQCRCVLSVETEFDTKEAQRFAVRRDLGERQKVSAKLTYKEWFERQDEDFKIDRLGPTRYKLYKEGQLTIEKFSDTKMGRMLTLKELQNKYDISLKETAKDQIVFKSAKTIKEAEKWASENLGLEAVDFKGLDIRTANVMNETLAKTYNDYPKAKGKIKYYGTAQGAYTKQYEKKLKEYEEWLKKSYETRGRDKTQQELEMEAKRRIRKKSVQPRIYAFSTHPEWKELQGIGINKKYGKDYDFFMKELSDDNGPKGFHPIGCTTVKSVIDHEIGHQIEDILDIDFKNRSNSALDKGIMEVPNYHANLRTLFAKKNYTEIRDGLSGYAARNPSEFIAEGWAEFRNNDKPRELATIIGNAFDKGLRNIE